MMGGDELTLVVGGNLTIEMLPTPREMSFLRAFHLGRALRTPKKPRVSSIGGRSERLENYVSEARVL
jgi:hypothetical protein